jgi:nucleoside-diphosphate-sugar epimerase
MAKRIFLAGATGVIGQRLVPLLAEAGYDVFGMTRSPAKADALQAAGARPVIVNAFDALRLDEVMMSIKPKIVIHQLTDLPHGLDPTQMGEAVKRNALIRSEGTHNLVAAARKAGARRLVAQSIVWAYAPGPEPHVESDPLDLHTEGPRAISVGGVAILEQTVLDSPPLEGVVLRYGQLYGPGTGSEEPTGSAPLHVDAAAWAALLAVEKAPQGIFNIAEPNPYASTAKANAQLSWDAGFRLTQTNQSAPPSKGSKAYSLAPVNRG